MDIKKLIDGISRIKIGLITATIDGERIFPYLEAAQELIEKQQWIPVAERLPAGDMFCWVTVANPGTVRCVHAGYYQLVTGFSWSNVVAWAPKDVLKPYLKP